MLAEFVCGQGMIVTITALSGNIHHDIMTKVDVPTILHFKECELVVAENTKIKTSNRMLANKSWQVKNRVNNFKDDLLISTLWCFEA